MTRESGNMPAEVHKRGVLPRAPSDQAWLCGLTLAVLGLGLARTQPNFRGDQAVFTTVADGVARGDRLYADVFDHKDPIFFWLGGIAHRLVGAHGPFLVEIALFCVLACAVFVIARRRDLDAATASAVAFLVVAFLVRRGTYHGLSTSTVGLAVAGLGIMFVTTGRVRLAGFAFATLFFAKMPYILLALPGAVVLARTYGRRAFTQMVAVGGLTTMMWTLVLVVRGEFGGYVDSINVNLTYSRWPRQQFQSIGVREHILLLWDLVSESDVLLVIFAAMFASAAVFVARARDQGWRSPEAVGPLNAAATFAATMTILGLTYFYRHHVQVVAVALGLIGIEAARMVRVASWRWLGMVVAVFLVVSPTIEDRHAVRGVVDRWSITEPQAAVKLEAAFAQLQPTGEVDVAIMNGHIQSFMPFVDERFDLICPLFYQHGWFEHRIVETAECMSTDADFVVRLDRADWEQLPRQLEPMQAVLDAEFELRTEQTLFNGTKLLIFEASR